MKYAIFSLVLLCLCELVVIVYLMLRLIDCEISVTWYRERWHELGRAKCEPLK